MQRIELHIPVGKNICPTDCNVIYLFEKEGSRVLPVVTNPDNTEFLMCKLHGIKPIDEITLTSAICREYKITVDEIFIYKFEEGVFSVKMTFNNNGEQKIIDVSIIDAITAYLEFKCPIFVTDDIMDRIGLSPTQMYSYCKFEIEAADEDFEGMPTPQFNIKKASIEELKKAMGIAIDDEDYEFATIIRDEINRRNSKNK